MAIAAGGEQLATVLSGTVVVLVSVWLIAFAGLVLVRPKRAERFLSGFASSLRAHLTEMGLRLVAGAGFIVFSPKMRFEQAFHVFGWVLLVTAVALLAIPWRVHQRFAERVIPPTIRYLGLYALGSLALGSFVLFGVIG